MMNGTILSVAPNKWYDSVWNTTSKQSTINRAAYSFNVSERLNTLHMFQPVVNVFKSESGTPDQTHVIRTLLIISVWCLPCNTGNPNQNHKLHITVLHTNYRHQMHTNLPLVVGVIFAPQQSYFDSMSVCFTVWVIAGLACFPCVLTTIN